MKRATRVVLHIFLPPLLGGLAMASPMALLQPRELWQAAVVYVLYGYLFAGVPSACYAVAMEVAFARGVVPGTGTAVAVSTALGAVSGVTIVLVMSAVGGRWPHVYALVIFAAIGMAVGAGTEGILTLLEKRVSAAKRRASSSGP